MPPRKSNLRVFVAVVLGGSIMVWWIVANKLVGASAAPDGVLDDEPWVGCATQGEVCTCGLGHAVRFGVDGVWTERKICEKRPWKCDTPDFGVDPVPNKIKRCECRAMHEPTYPCLGSECADQLPDCEARASQGFCRTDETLSTTCRRSCGLCIGGVSKPKTEPKQQPVINKTVSDDKISSMTGGAIMDFITMMRKEPAVDPAAWKKAMDAKYPDGKMPNPLKTACTHRNDANEQLLKKVEISPTAATPRILCLVYTMSDRKEAMNAIKDTYGAKCDGLLFMSTETNPEGQELRVWHKGKEEYMNMWQKSRSIWGYVAAQQADGAFNYDWFIIGGDDLYVMVDNLRAYVGSPEISKASQNNTKPMFLGRRFKDPGGFIFNSGGAGYVLNRRALETLYANLDTKACHPDMRHFSEDRETAVCLHQAGVVPYDTKDELGEERFMPFSPDLHYTYRAANYKKDWYKEYTLGLKEGMEAMSKQVVSFHYLKPLSMRRVHALIYHCRPGSSSLSMSSFFR